MPYKDKQRRKEYHSKYMREVWYPANRERHNSRVRVNDRKRALALREKFDAYKLSIGCMDCGYAKHAEALDFDHVRGVKRDNVGTMVRKRCSWREIMAEIRKCEIVCANCHRIRTASRRKQI